VPSVTSQAVQVARPTAVDVRNEDAICSTNVLLGTLRAFALA